jgi:hypothetical protein
MKHVGFAVMAALSISPPAVASDMHLVCQGTASYLVDEGGGGTWAGGGAGAGGSWSGAGATAPRESMQQTSGEVMFELSDAGTGRMRVPDVLTGSGLVKRDNWLALKDVKITDTEITGNYQGRVYAIVPVTRSFTIDRMTGHIEMFRFSGTCEPYDSNPATRKF